MTSWPLRFDCFMRLTNQSRETAPTAKRRQSVIIMFPAKPILERHCKIVGIGSVGFVLAMPDGGFTAWALQDSIELSLGDLIGLNSPGSLGGENLFHICQSRVFEARGESGVSNFKAACAAVAPIRQIKLD